MRGENKRRRAAGARVRFELGKVKERDHLVKVRGGGPGRQQTSQPRKVYGMVGSQYVRLISSKAKIV